MISGEFMYKQVIFRSIFGTIELSLLTWLVTMRHQKTVCEAIALWSEECPCALIALYTMIWK